MTIDNDTVLNPEDYDVPAEFRHWPGNPAVNRVGPFFLDAAWEGSEEGDVLRTAFRATADHANTIDTVHGGILMTFADYTLCIAALSEDFPNCATISINTDFVRPGILGELITGFGTLTRRTKSTAFTSCVLKCNDEVIMTATGIIRVFGPGKLAKNKA